MYARTRLFLYQKSNYESHSFEYRSRSSTRKIWFAANQREYYKAHRGRSVPALQPVPSRARNENKDEHLTILSRESPRGTRDGASKPWLTGTSAGCWMLGVRLGGIIPNHLSLGQADNPFRISRSLARLRFLLPRAASVSFYSRESSQYADKKLTTPALRRNSRTD